MPRLTPIHYKIFEKILLRLGCVIVRTEGDHRIWQRVGLKRPLVVRSKKDLSIMEIKSNLRTLGLSNEEFLQLLAEI